MKKFIKLTSLALTLFIILSNTSVYAYDKIENYVGIDSASPTSDIYQEGIYRFDINCTRCIARAKFLTPNTSGVIIVISPDNTMRLFKTCTVDNADLEIGSLSKDDTVIIVGKGEFEIIFVR